ncbi:hypothetical protein K227x_01070 [Rubripirellula lacrimiformis]|uniref:DUF885 domain-containing protein n=1 Tax=Rubripirellula lacrimiformis TaxID=1930273 RepID=A0A517N3L9_9BACT|nr:DUF885 domain-containing protein [Rubripirellula lacrimiformis]QDT01740.1 hypothetical protein K227x_01070 [Rubripirellula lacrimiformis]
MRCPIACLLLTSLMLVTSQVSALMAEDTTATNPSEADSRLVEILDTVWDYELNENPNLATNVGDDRGQDRLADDSLEAIDRRNAKRKEFLEQLTSIAPESLSPFRQIDQELLRLRLEGQIADHRFQTHLMPINNREGFHIGFPELPREMNPRTPADFKNYIARLRDFDRYTDQQIALLRAGIAADLTQPSIIMRDSVEQARSHVVDDPDESLLMTNIAAEAKTTLGKDTWDPIAAQIRDAIRTSVVPAYRRFADFLETEYVPACRGAIGASALPRGARFYRDRILRFTTLELGPDEVHQRGVRENARIRKEMEAIIEDVEFDGTFDEFLHHLRTDPKFYAKTPQELLRHAAMILKTADGRLPELFGRLPRIPYGIREIPAYVAPQTTSAYYWPPSTDGTRAGFYYINTYNLSSRPLYQLESLSMHEAVPGHHLQLAIQAELTDLHPISRESNFTAFIEGWALYSEKLGKEIGFYQDPYQDFGRLSMEAWRASRLVVDTGIHAMGWTRQQAIEYMKSNTALSEHNVVAEVDRYIGWPGQALGYKMGELAISRLRRSAEDQLGDQFDVRAFHDRVLESGSIPLPLLEKRVQEWIQAQKSAPTTAP